MFGREQPKTLLVGLVDRVEPEEHDEREQRGPAGDVRRSRSLSRLTRGVSGTRLALGGFERGLLLLGGERHRLLVRHAVGDEARDEEVAAPGDPAQVAVAGVGHAAPSPPGRIMSTRSRPAPLASNAHVPGRKYCAPRT